MPTDTVFVQETAPLKFGWGVTAEVGRDARWLGMTQCLLVSDPRVHELGLADEVATHLRDAGVGVEVFHRVRSEPSDRSWQAAIEVARAEDFDGFVAVGGGSAIDTAKAANLLSTHPGDLMDYVNQPVGLAKPVPGPLKPLIAVPTTAGTGSETTPVAVVDVGEAHVKTGISHRHLRPRLALNDPENTLTMPPMVTASTGLDVLCHAIEAYLMIWYDTRPAPEDTTQRKPYNGANPISDIWCERAVYLVGKYLQRAVADGDDREARYQMLLASTMAGVGFGNAGVHIPHAMGYPVASLVRDYLPPDYAADHPMVPHGVATILGAPAVFRFTGAVDHGRHLRMAELLGCDTAGVAACDAGKLIADKLVSLMREMNLPNGVSGVGFTEDDIPALVEGAMKQQRILCLSPRAVTEEDMKRLYQDAMRYW